MLLEGRAVQELGATTGPSLLGSVFIEAYTAALADLQSLVGDTPLWREQTLPEDINTRVASLRVRLAERLTEVMTRPISSAQQVAG